MNYESRVRFTIKTMDLTANRRFVEVVSFNSSIEHPKIGEKILLKDEFRKITLPNGVEIKFEEIIGLAGDFYGLPENPVIDPFKEEEEDFLRKERFRGAYDTLARAPKDELQKELDKLSSPGCRNSGRNHWWYMVPRHSSYTGKEVRTG